MVSGELRRRGLLVSLVPARRTTKDGRGARSGVIACTKRDSVRVLVLVLANTLVRFYT